LEHPLLIVAYFVLVLIVVTVAIWGDLLESLFKRRCGVKDSSALIPAMGGFFDTFDSVIFIPAITIAYIKLITFVLLVIG
jgi:phosphatidate cytidylyltransferase